MIKEKRLLFLSIENQDIIYKIKINKGYTKLIFNIKN